MLTLREFQQSDFWLPVNDPENITLNNIIEISTTEYKKIQKDKVLKRKQVDQLKIEVE